MTASTEPTRLGRFAHGAAATVGGFAVALACFLVLPLLEAISATEPADLVVSGMETTALPPPPPPPEPAQEEDKPQEDQPPPPSLADEAPPLDLSQMELALNPGMGGMDGAGDFAVKIAGVGGAGGGDKGVDELFSLADLDQKPRPVFQQQPTLTALLKKKLPANVVVVFTVDQQGRVENPVVQSASDPAFEQPVLAAIKQWKFEPGKRSGKAVRFRMRQPFSFQ
jgi:protein TonB